MSLLLLFAGGSLPTTVYTDEWAFRVLDAAETPHPEFTRWTETDSAIIQRGILGDGVTSYGGAVVSPTTPPSVAVSVSSGTGRQSGTDVTIAGGILPIPLPNPTQPRIDLIGFDNAGALHVVIGELSGDPYPPDLPVDLTALAFVYVWAGALSLGTLDILSKRMLLSS